jgi:predicted phosphodiesterase
MRIRVLSDLHCEFEAYSPPPTAADVVVLAGDIHHATKGLDWAAGRFPGQTVVYVAGNHEYYGESLPELTQRLQAHAAELGIAFLENAVITVGGVHFLGCTLWTDMQLFDRNPWVVDAVKAGLVDYRAIRVGPSYRRLRPADTIGWHRESVAWLRDALADMTGTAVVVTHHAPSARSLRPGYETDWVSAGFASHLDELVRDGGAALWVHGHTHHAVDYCVGRTRVVSNPLGYRDEQLGFVDDLIIDLPATHYHRDPDR